MPPWSGAYGGKSSVQVVFDKRTGYYIRKKPTGGNNVVTPARQRARDDFKQAVELVKQLDGIFIQQSIDQTANTGYLVRDLLIHAMYGKLLEVETADGKFYMSRRIALSQIETMLKSISTTNGALLFYSATYQNWVALVPGTEGQYIKLVDGVPEWADIVIPDPTPNSVLDQLSPVAGSMVFYDGTNWLQLAPGTDNDILVIDPTTHLPKWVPLTSSFGGTSIDMYDPPLAADYATIINGGGDTPAPFATDEEWGLVLSAGKAIATTTHLKAFVHAPLNAAACSLAMGNWRFNAAGFSWNSVCGLVMTDGTGFVSWGPGTSYNGLVLAKGTTFTGFTSLSTQTPAAQSSMYLKLERNASNFVAWMSGDGRDWHVAAETPNTAIGTVTGIGFMVSSYSGGSGADFLRPMTLTVPWAQET